MTNTYPTRLVRSLTKATDNQLKYWVKIGLVFPNKKGKTYFYSFRDLIKLKLIVFLKNNGLSLQKIKKGIKNLTKLLPDTDEPLTRLIIHTDGVDMIVNEKGKYFSVTTMQRYLCFDTEQINSEVIEMHAGEKFFNNAKRTNKVQQAEINL
jgi:DNA-binding transcriptional MerR regulator